MSGSSESSIFIRFSSPGKRFLFFPIRFIYNVVPRPDEKSYPVQTGFSVPKKKFRNSVHRHRIRRLMAEAWRLNKHALYASVPEGQQLHLFLIFTDSTMPVYETVKDAVLKGIDKLVVSRKS